MKLTFVGFGFISYSVAFLLSKKHEITITTRERALPPSHPVKRAYYEDLSYFGVKFVQLDPLKDVERLREVIKRSDAVVNFVGAIQGSERELKEANYAVPKALAKLIEDANPNAFFVHISAASLGQKEKKVVEEYPHGFGLEPQTAFEESKLMGEKAVLQSKVRKAILRPTLAYGWAAAHRQFITLYKFAKRRIVPKVNIAVQPVNVRYIAAVIDALLEERPETDYLYVTECEKVGASDVIRLYCQGLGKKCFELPVPSFLQNLSQWNIPEDARPLLRYLDYEFSCQRTKDFVKNPTFVEDDIRENAKFLKLLDETGRLVPE
ncbi:MAG: NAD-dependent epimerase/dehydratase family protein [Thermoprotei archaeon]